jgi:energy-coupling factor transporter transmembrane protein EcfT
MVEGVFVIPSYFYLVITLIVFAVVGFFAMKKHLCFRIHAIGIFFAILFFIKWFTYLGTEYWSLLIAGAVAIAGAVYFMKEMKKMSCGMKTVTAPIAKKVATAPIKKTAIKKTNKKVPTKKPVKKTIKKKTTKK